MNSTSATATPARSAMPVPSPVHSLLSTAKHRRRRRSRHRVPSPDLASTPSGSRAHADRPIAFDDQVTCEPTFTHLRRGVAHCGDERPFDLGAGAPPPA
jgi:hypothetical protein